MGYAYAGADLALDLLLGGAQARPATLHVALLTAAGASSQTGSTISEPTSGGYARVAVTNDGTTFNAANTRVITNAIEVAFPTATGPWGQIVGYALCDAATAGNLIAYGTLDTPITVVTDDTPTFAVGALTVSLPV